MRIHIESVLLLWLFAASPASAATGLISSWAGDGNANDSFGSNNGTFNGSFVSGKIGQAFSISSGTYVSIPNAANLNPTNALTIEAWIYRQSKVGSYDPIVKKAGLTDGPYALEFSGDTLCFWIFTGGWQGCCGGTVPTNQWVHVAGTYDGTMLRVFINGVTTGATPATGQITPSTNPVNFGRDPSGNGRAFNGRIDEVHIYNRALDQAEIRAIYNGFSIPNYLPASGPTVPELAPLEQAMTNCMVTNNFKAGTIALMKNSRLVFRQGYGWRDTNLSVVIHPDNIFRLASVSKPITISAITKLVNDGKLTMNTKVYSFLGIQPWGGVLGDSRITNITVQNLIDHSGGWYGGGSGGEWVFRTIDVSSAMGLTYPAAGSNIASWVFSKPLDFTPGTTNVYSNIGYQMLGRVVEKASGKSYINYLQQDMFWPYGVTNIIQSRSRPNDLNPWEIWYADASVVTLSAVDYPTNLQVRLADGGYYYESFDSFGGLSASALGLCQYMLNYWVGGDRRYPGENYGWGYSFYGGLPGCSTVIYQNISENSTSTNGLEFAAFLNEAKENQLASAILSAVTNITSWPTNGGGQIQWAVNSTNVNENAGSVSVQLVRNGTSTLPVKISYTTYGKTAGTNNFVANSGILSFAAGETNKTVTISLLDDHVINPAKQLSLELISASGGAWLGDRLTCTIQILDTDTMFVGSPNIFGNGLFRANLTGATGQQVRVQFSTNLFDWQLLQTFTNISGTINVIDSNAPSRSRSFYRAFVP
jgi:CubicO group peptidase (beta-lactamase class C family)